MTIITPNARRIEEILNEQTKYIIPNYQREFKWGETEAQELLEDLNSYKSENLGHLFLGNFIFESPKVQRTSVVDGQQRITSIMLLLIACRMHAKKLNEVGIQHKIQEKITFTDSATAQSLGCRFIPSESIRDLFEYMANIHWDGVFPSKIEKKQVKRQKNRIKPIYDFFLGQIADFDSKELSQFLRAIYNTYVFQVIVKDDEEALRIFERTNARGLDLEVADLLKNYLFSQRVPSIEDKWKEILFYSDGTMLRMLKYFYVSKKGYISKPQLYRKLKEYADSEDIGAETFTTELVEFARFYSLTKDPTKLRTQEYFEGIGLESIYGYEENYASISASLQALKEFGITQFCPVAYSAVQSARENSSSKSDAKYLVRLFDSFEKYHFVNNVICERVGNEVEKLYADTCKNFSESNDIVRTTQKLINDLRAKRASWDEFQSRFTEISYTSDNKAIIYYIFDRIVNLGCHPDNRLTVYNPDPRVLRKSNNIEHFFPQNPPEEIKIDKSLKESIDNIGNLLPIYYRTNSKLGNLSPVEKMKKLKNEWRKEIQNSPFVQEFVESYGDKADNWDANLIKDRAKELAETAFNRVWKLD